MRKYILIVTFVVGSSCVFAQQDVQFSQYMLNKLFINPAYAGMRDALCFSLMGRQQWAGFDGSPRSGVLSADLVLPEDWSGGIGMNILFDDLGFERNTRISIDYAHHFVVGKQENMLSIGLEAGAFNKRLGPTGGEQWQATTNWMNDPSIPTGISNTVADLGFGVWYQTRSFYLGISSTHLGAQQIDDGTGYITGFPDHDLVYQLARHYFLTGGMKLHQHHTWGFEPSLLIKSDAVITSVDVSCIATYRDKFWLGASYRMKDSFIPMIGFQRLADKGEHSDFFEGGFKAGFAYDLTLSGLRNYNSGTFEIYVNYCLPFDYRTTRWGDVRNFN